MPIHICSTCGTSYPEAANPPARCPICEDERQFVPRGGQSWTTPAALAARHANAWRALEPGLIELHTRPDFAISQRALLLRTPQGNILWDCLALIDEATVEIVKALGGLKAIAISHPHYYTRIQDWAQAFGAPVHLHAADREWVMRGDPAIRFWEGERLTLAEGVTLAPARRAFPGRHGAALGGRCRRPWRAALRRHRPGRRRYAPRLVPVELPQHDAALGRHGEAHRRYARAAAFDRVYGAFPGREVLSNAKEAVANSAKRYVELLEEDR